MKSLSRFVAASTLALAIAFTSAAPSAAQEGDIVDIAVGAGAFETLVAAVGAAELVEVLRSEGPFTVFAPTDEAFAALPAGTVPTLLLPENRDRLVAILTYHVVPGRVLAADVVNLTSAPTVNGQSLTIKVDESGVMVDNARVVQTDILATNGVIHIIDAVLIPSDTPTPVESNSWGNIKNQHH